MLAAERGAVMFVWQAQDGDDGVALRSKDKDMHPMNAQAVAMMRVLLMLNPTLESTGRVTGLQTVLKSRRRPLLSWHDAQAQALRGAPGGMAGEHGGHGAQAALMDMEASRQSV